MDSVVGARRIMRTGLAKWPEMEADLFIAFCAARKKRRSINHQWFLRTAKAIYSICYPNEIGFDEENKAVYDCLFSNGWFARFKKRWCLSWRCKTNVASKPPEDYHPKIINFCRFNRGNSQLQEREEMSLDRVGRFSLVNIFNIDQTLHFPSSSYRDVPMTSQATKQFGKERYEKVGANDKLHYKSQSARMEKIDVNHL